ncbi:hypothetical protein TWF225_001333 [Orbilia oligospora]|nr:hypothetical protein TWF225_001333 [Orbilia oligospora]KAF3265350.1 hypothetical protein TWF128_000616 [Orbilia oligospora]KAF3272875.1 hypothetical protein TWF217_000333 [Orbilia oligospora]KAF3273332.1 hypothetical protein TWF132_005478 [Orbilia oligospora]
MLASQTTQKKLRAQWGALNNLPDPERKSHDKGKNRERVRRFREKQKLARQQAASLTSSNPELSEHTNISDTGSEFQPSDTDISESTLSQTSDLNETQLSDTIQSLIPLPLNRQLPQASNNFNILLDYAIDRFHHKPTSTRAAPNEHFPSFEIDISYEELTNLNRNEPSNHHALSNSNRNDANKDSSDDSSSTEMEIGQTEEQLLSIKFLLKRIFNIPSCTFEEHTEDLDDDSISLSTLIKQWDESKFGNSYNLISQKKDVLRLIKSQSIWLDSAAVEKLELIFTGRTQNRQSQHLSLHKDEVPVLNLRVTFDVDSVIGFPGTIAFCKMGFAFNSHPSPIRNLTNTVHLKVAVSGKKRKTSRPLIEIPHFHFGHSIGFSELDVFIFFPKLYSKSRRSNNFLSDDHKSQFFDSIWLPVLQQVLPHNILQHIPPRTFAACKLNAKANRAERVRNEAHDTKSSSIQQFHYSIPAEYLPSIWSEVLRRTDQPGLQHFQDLFLFVNAKNLKNDFKEAKLANALTKFRNRWRSAVEESAFEPRSIWIDIAREITNEPRKQDGDNIGVTLLWKNCCHEKIFSQISHEKFVRNLGQAYYHVALLHQAQNFTISPQGLNPLAQGGIAYGQSYAIIKENFIAGKLIPFDDNNIEGLSVDEHIRNAWYQEGRGWKKSSESMEAAYQQSRKRIYEQTQNVNHQNYGVREEYRIRGDLLLALIESQESMPHLWNQGVCQSLADSITRPFWAVSTQTLINFIRVNITKFCFGFDMTRYQNLGKVIRLQQTSLGLMFFRLLRRSFMAHLLCRENELWKNRSTDEDDDQKRGLDLQTTLSDQGYGFLPSEIINWMEWCFVPGFAHRTLFVTPFLQQAYARNQPAIRGIQLQFSELDELLRLFAICMDKTYDMATVGEEILTYVSTYLIRQFRREVYSDVENYWQYLMEVKSQRWSETKAEHDKKTLDVLINQKELAEAGRLPLFYKTYYAIIYDPENPCKKATDNIQLGSGLAQRKKCSQQFTNVEWRARYLWDFDDDLQRSTWNDRVFRQLFQYVIKSLQSLGYKIHAHSFREWHLQNFIRTNHIFPNSSRDKFWQCHKGDRFSRRWFVAYPKFQVSNLKFPFDVEPKQTFWKLWQMGSFKKTFKHAANIPYEPGLHLSFEDTKLILEDMMNYVSVEDNKYIPKYHRLGKRNYMPEVQRAWDAELYRV